MDRSRRQFLQLVAGTAALPAAARRAFAQDYPARPVRVIVPFAPGGQTDVIARLVTQKLTDKLGKNFYVENVPGAGSTIGVGRAAQSPPDGYTILFVDGIAFVANPSIYNKVPYDPAADFEPIGIAATTMQVLAVHPSVPAKTTQELVALIRSSPGKYSYASAGTGTGSHLTGELFRLSLNLDLVHVPYGGGGPAIAATVAGHTPISFGSAAATIPQHQDGKLRILAVGGAKRLKSLPDIPTIREGGYNDVACDAVVGILAPARTPKEIVALLNKAVGEVVAAPDVQERLNTLGFEPETMAPDELAAFFKADLPKWAKVIKDAGVKAQ
jgi:tripartite-type tricarboxylate transporter receptor subunit TctC